MKLISSFAGSSREVARGAAILLGLLLFPGDLSAQPPAIISVVNEARSDTKLASGVPVRITFALSPSSVGFRPTLRIGEHLLTSGGNSFFPPEVEGDEPEVHLILPDDLPPGPAWLVATSDAGSSEAFPITLEQYAPAFVNRYFSHFSGSTATPPYVSLPCFVPDAFAPGEVVSNLVTGLGSADLHGSSLLTPVVKVDGKPVELLESVRAGSGQYRISFRAPNGNGLLPVVLSVNGQEAPAAVLPVGDVWVSRYSVGLATASPESIVVGGTCGGGLTGSWDSTGQFHGDASGPPTELGGVTVRVADSQGVERLAQLLYVDNATVQYVVPKGTASGLAHVTVAGKDGYSVSGYLDIRTLAPLVNLDQPTSTAYVHRVRNGVATVEPAVRLCSRGYYCFSVDMGQDQDLVYLVILSTGLRNRSSLANVKLFFGTTEAAVEYVGPQVQVAGLDQVNVRLPRSLAGIGSVSLQLIVDGIRIPGLAEFR